VSVTSILAHRDTDLEWGGDHPISEEHGKKIKAFLPRNPPNPRKIRSGTLVGFVDFVAGIVLSFQLFFPCSSVDSVANIRFFFSFRVLPRLHLL
jgi:hypothetical protein